MLKVSIGAFVSKEDIRLILISDCPASKELVKLAKEQDKLINVCQGKKRASIILMDGGIVVASSFGIHKLIKEFRGILPNQNSSTETDHN